ncbi:hypothetical protein SKAU_G00064920 [Synaphobranchus kaupii]|uniref:Uncharacterized protein n=1 Tax=Synaphobranchus kaupii TaxID=118154 RepID=A0A9Q1G6N5_SYNKA|nr:hypothetical protein SKAU_G00064920 [Synaphobranchus kaupii]
MHHGRWETSAKKRAAFLPRQRRPLLARKRRRVFAAECRTRTRRGYQSHTGLWRAPGPGPWARDSDYDRPNNTPLSPPESREEPSRGSLCSAHNERRGVCEAFDEAAIHHATDGSTAPGPLPGNYFTLFTLEDEFQHVPVWQRPSQQNTSRFIAADGS